MKPGYFFKFYALDTILKGLSKPAKATLETAMQGHVIEMAEWVGTCEKVK